MTSSTPRMALIRVNTLARTMSDTLRAARVGTSLLLPSATRCATSASVSRPQGHADGHLVKTPLPSASKYSNVSLSPSKVALEIVPGGAFSVTNENVNVLPSQWFSGTVKLGSDRQLQLPVRLGDPRRSPVVVVVGARRKTPTARAEQDWRAAAGRRASPSASPWPRRSCCTTRTSPREPHRTERGRRIPQSAPRARPQGSRWSTRRSRRRPTAG